MGYRDATIRCSGDVMTVGEGMSGEFLLGLCPPFFSPAFVTSCFDPDGG